MQAAAHAPMTTAEFFEWEPRDDGRYELRDGFPVAMAPTATAHQILVIRLARYLDEALDDRPACTARADAPITPLDRDDAVHVADLVVSCRPPEGPGHRGPTEEPLVVVEVLSPSTERHDRRVKLPDYRALPTVREIVLVATDQLYCEVHRRTDDDRWTVDLLRTPEAELRLTTIGFAQPLSTLYRKVPLEAS